MRALVIHESLTGNTRTAAGHIVDALAAEGWTASECSSREVDLAALQAADVVIVGSWVDGLFFFGQRPGGSGKLTKLPLLGNKTTYVYVTYAVDPGKTLAKLTATTCPPDRPAAVADSPALTVGPPRYARRRVGDPHSGADRDAGRPIGGSAVAPAERSR